MDSNLYRILSDTDEYDLSVAVSAVMRQGFVPAGGVSHVVGHDGFGEYRLWVQAVYRPGGLDDMRRVRRLGNKQEAR